MQDGDQKVHLGIWLQNGPVLGVKEVVEFAQEAEKAGWDGVFVSDEPSGYSDPWTELAAIAAQTEDIKLGTWITPISNNLPWRLAQILATLDQLSNGRVILGAGLGTPYEHRAFGGSYDPKKIGRKYDEALEIIVRLWQGESVTFSGEFFRLSEAQLAITPIQKPRIPILLAAWWPNKKPFRRAAKWDGIMPYWPALLSQGSGPQGEESSGTIEEELRDLLAYYHSLRDGPSEILLPYRSDRSYLDLCIQSGATWLLATDITKLGEIQEGPPAIQ